MNVWGCFTSSGVGRLYKIPGIMDSKMYKQILIHQLIPSANELFKDKSWVFQQDNDPKHTANNVKNYLKNKKLVVLSWPAQSPDLNPIENLWSILDHGIKTRAPKNEEELFQILQNQWKNISGELLQSLVESMPRRCKAMIKSRGGLFRYFNKNSQIFVIFFLFFFYLRINAPNKNFLVIFFYISCRNLVEFSCMSI